MLLTNGVDDAPASLLRNQRCPEPLFITAPARSTKAGSLTRMGDAARRRSELLRDMKLGLHLPSSLVDITAATHIVFVKRRQS